MTLLGFELVFRLLWGWLFFLMFISRSETSERFPRVAIYIATGFALFAGWLAHGGGALGPRVPATLALLVLGSVLYAFLTPRYARTVGFLTVIGAPWLIIASRPLPDILNFFLSSFLLGSVFMGQYLGHWYLNAPGMHIRELRRIVLAAVFSVGFKVAEAAWTLFVRIGLEPPLHVDVMGRPAPPSLGFQELSIPDAVLGLSGDGAFGLGFYGLMMLAMRALWGLLAPMLLVWMVKKTVDVRSTQSATGILYALCVMILIGEGTAIFFWRNLGWNL